MEILILTVNKGDIMNGEADHIDKADESGTKLTLVIFIHGDSDNIYPYVP